MQLYGSFRHELKYSITYAGYLALRSRLRAVLQPDAHAGPDGRYTIRSIYFDTPDDQALREKADGLARREKFRIRYYNDDFSHLTLEKKAKHDALCMKTGARLSEEECRRLLAGDLHWMPAHPEPLVRELYVKMQTQRLYPRVLVSYTREPYVYAPGNVRITFDSNIRTTLFHREFLEEQVRDVPATDEPGDMLLEVKYDAYLPEIVRMLLQEPEIRVQSFSKYGACRRFG